MASFWDNLYTKYRQGSVSTKLIYINTAIFLLIKVFLLICRLFQWNAGAILLSLEQPADWMALLQRPWSLFTYIFIHERFLHLFFNMLWLYFFGKFFLQWFTSKQFLLAYFLGGICGGLFFALGYNTFNYYEQFLDASLLTGSSAAVFAVAIAATFYRPDQTLNLMFIGSLKLKWLAVIMIVMDILSLAGDNAGGSFAHIGGAFLGMLYGYLSKPDSMLTNVRNLFTPLAGKTKTKKYHRSKEETNVDQAYRDRKKAENDRRDAILDKIKDSGYDSLNEEEKTFLFHLSNKN